MRTHYQIEAEAAVEGLCGYDYANQAWVEGGLYVACGHPATMKCGCYGRLHAGEPVAANAEVH